MNTAATYVKNESQYFPQHWDEQDKAIVMFMLQEAFTAGYNSGFTSGQVVAINSSIVLTDELLTKLHKGKEKIR